MPFSCKVTMPGPYADSVTKAREIESKITAAAKKAMSYVMNLKEPEAPDVDFFDDGFMEKYTEWANSFAKYSLIHKSIEKAKAALVQNKDAGAAMETYLRTEGVAELLTQATFIPTRDFKLDFGTAALASAAWYLKADVRCVNRRPVPQGNSAEFIKKGDALFQEVVTRSGLTERELLGINCDRKSIWDRLPLAMLTWASRMAKPFCGVIVKQDSGVRNDWE